MSQICPAFHRTCELTSIATTTADYSSCSNSSLSLPVIIYIPKPIESK
ncbi:MAG TPA: hypothetical protein VE244_15115 [Nitrososphaeraceae archaeon]|nr:hypothetical protein [Nitrososphaeraceae archaeon]